MKMSLEEAQALGADFDDEGADFHDISADF